jgi:DNA-directed RNA polymerase specialized sigma24 family protein
MGSKTAVSDREAMLAEVERLAGEIGGQQARLDRRGDLFLQLAEDGVPQTELARLSNVTKAAVSIAIDRARQRNGKG